MIGNVEPGPTVRWAADGLVPVIVQDAADGRVLMLGYANAEALALTLETGEVHFWSRSRTRLWRKGETSGNVLRLLDLAVDCDADALLARVEPAGPTCHRGTRSCFDPVGALVAPDSAAGPAHGREGRGEGVVSGPAADGFGRFGAAPPASAGAGVPAAAALPAAEGFAWLETLWATIARRAAERPEGSYTARLLAGGVDAPARKVAEEATEVLMAAKDDAIAQRDGASRAATADALAGEVADLVYHALVLLAERGLPPSVVIDRLRARHAP